MLDAPAGGDRRVLCVGGVAIGDAGHYTRVSSSRGGEDR
jgi:hypothetical protein